MLCVFTSVIPESEDRSSLPRESNFQEQQFFPRARVRRVCRDTIEKKRKKRKKEKKTHRFVPVDMDFVLSLLIPR